MSDLVWVITGSSHGFGKAIALAALARGDKVIATARTPSKLADLQAAGAEVLQLDVTADLGQLQKVAADAHAKYGRVTHLVNSAGYIFEGAAEEASAQETFDQFNTNVFGALNVTRAFLPYLRAHGRAVIANFGSLGSWRGVPGGSLYAGTKWAISGISESLRTELEPFGIKTCVIEPGYFRSGFLNPGARIKSDVRMQEYEDTVVGQTRRALDATDNRQPGDVQKGARVIVDALTSSGVAQGRDVPMRLVLGSDCDAAIRGKLKETERLLDEWKDVIYSTDYPEGE